MGRDVFDRQVLEDLLYQALETDVGGIAIYRRAIECAIDPAPAVLPPPEAQRHVETAMGAAHAEAARECMLGAVDVKKAASGR